MNTSSSLEGGLNNMSAYQACKKPVHKKLQREKQHPKRFLERAKRFLALQLAGACWLTIWMSQAIAQTSHNMLDLQNEVHAWIEHQLLTQTSTARYHIQVHPLQDGLRLAACSIPLEIQQHGRNELHGRVNLRVACAQAEWFIYVSAEIALWVPVVVARATLARNTQLDAQVLEVQEMEVSRLRGQYFTQIAEVEGRRLRTRVQQGSVLTSQQVLAGYAIQRGDQVTIHAIGANLQVRMQGEALDNGQIGDQVRVRNQQSGRIIRAQVVRRGGVEVYF